MLRTRQPPVPATCHQQGDASPLARHAAPRRHPHSGAAPRPLLVPRTSRNPASAAAPSDALADAPLLAQNQRPDAFLPFAAWHYV